jgi:signal peptidase
VNPTSPQAPQQRIRTVELWAIILGWLGLVYYLPYLGAFASLTQKFGFYITYSFLWLCLALFLFLFWKSVPEPKPKAQRGQLLLAAGVGLAQVSIAVLAGVIFGFGHSPYAHTPLALLQNAFYLASLLAGMEMARATLLVSTSRRNSMLVVFVVAVLMVAVETPYTRFETLTDFPAIVRFIGESLLPSLSLNLLACFLALAGGPLPAILYRAVLLAFEWGSPILPNLNWAITALVGTLVPALGILYTQQLYFSEETPKTAQPGAVKRSPYTSWIIVLLIAVLAIWFNVGVFGVRPFLVSGYSMKPTFELGDLVIVQDAKTADIHVGDVVRYTRDNISIVHRVLEIQQANGSLVFITKGDNNNVADPPVPENLVQGRVVGIIPKIGWVSIGIRQVFGWAR